MLHYLSSILVVPDFILIWKWIDWWNEGVQRIGLDVLLWRGESRDPAESELHDDGLPALHLRRRPLPTGGRPPPEDQVPPSSDRGLCSIYTSSIFQLIALINPFFCICIIHLHNIFIIIYNIYYSFDISIDWFN